MGRVILLKGFTVDLNKGNGKQRMMSKQKVPDRLKKLDIKRPLYLLIKGDIVNFAVGM